VSHDDQPVSHDDQPDRLDRELIELLNELRVALPGVQMLFGFLLAVPFTSRFGDLGTVDRAAYFLAFGAVAASSVLLIAPSAHHRVNWRQHDKESLLRTANREALAGLSFLAVAVAAAVFLVADRVYGRTAAAAAAVVCVAAICALWWAVPMRRRMRG
jgi:hypothetical protein